MTAIQAGQRIQVTVITGYVGSGKTTLLDHIPDRKHGRKAAAIVDEFGAVMSLFIDNRVIER